VNRKYWLESLNTSLSSSMRKLRHQRVASCHYIVDNSSDIIELKVNIAFERLASMPQECKDKLSNRQIWSAISGRCLFCGKCSASANVTDGDEEWVREWWTG
jgi:hypothetical protein